MIIPTAAAVMTTKVVQPKYLSNGEFNTVTHYFLAASQEDDKQDQRRRQEAIDYRRPELHFHRGSSRRSGSRVSIHQRVRRRVCFEHPDRTR